MDEKTEYVMCVISLPAENARAIALRLVNDNAAACVQITNPVTSIYRWEGKICEQAEVLLFLKTRMDKISAVTSIINELHPYKVPELIAIPVTYGNPDYLAWIDEVVCK
ncbi:MAG: divalent-cation tolerance protein CutA [Spirochaetaceae bacterium]|nr:MAG: divalent-cation tolerance protein CutA [Spirochaetaceae bacterium]